jgi:hypothetical protein
MATDAAANAIGAWLHGLATGAAHAVVGAHNYVESQPSLQEGVRDFVGGLVNGGAGQMQARVAVPAPKAAAPQGGGPRMPSAAFLKANPAVDAPQGSVNDVGGRTFLKPPSADDIKAAIAQASGGSASADSRPANAFDFVRQAALANPKLTIGQLGTVADAASRLIPQKALVPKDQVIAQYSDLANRYAAMVAQDPNYAATPAGQAHANLIQNLRSVVTPNPMFDINQALQQAQAAQEQGQAQ